MLPGARVLPLPHAGEEPERHGARRPPNEVEWKGVLLRKTQVNQSG